MENNNLVTIGAQIGKYAKETPNKTALIGVAINNEETALTWQELHQQSNQLAYFLKERGVVSGSKVVVSLPNTITHVLLGLAIWKLGACYVPICYSGAEKEKERLICLVEPTLVVAKDAVNWKGMVSYHELAAYKNYPDTDLPDCIAMPSRAIATGGSSGKPKLVMINIPAGYDENGIKIWFRLSGQDWFQRQLVAGPLYHTAPNTACYAGLFAGHLIVLMERFNEYSILDLVARHQIDAVLLVPTMMDRILRVINILDWDFGSIKAFCHMGAYCSSWLKQAWINLLGPERVYEFYGMSEMIGATGIRGDEWLLHPGSLGRPVNCDICICDENGNLVPNGVIGEIYMKPETKHITYYVGQPQLSEDINGFTSIGDMGWMDKDGYLFYVDRRVDMIVTGGVNVFAAEVETALLQHPKIADVVVIGLPDQVFGKKIHAIIQPESMSDKPTISELKAFCAIEISSLKLPKSFEFIAEIPRTQMGKVRRQELVKSRIQ